MPAAAEMGKTVELNYTWQYGNSYSPSSELQALVNGWYNNGTEVIFCCGGNMYQSVAQAAAENDAYMVGVDTDQSPLSETIITSAMKGLSDGVQWGLAYVFEGSFADIAGKSTTLSAKENAVGLPTATWSLKNFTVEQYQAELAKIVNGEITVDNNFEMSNPEKAELSNVKVNFVG
ncbi:MAG: BMP family lipoprotein [Angelakisella sp.]